MTDPGSEAPTQPGGRKYRMRWWTLAVLSASLLIIIVDDTIVNVALPTLQREWGSSAAALQWIVNSYILVFGGLLLTMGTLGDRFGRRRMLRLGFLLFGASSLYGAFAGSTTELIVARTTMGIGGAMIMPATLSVIIDVFPRKERVKAIGIWAGVAHLGIPLGPVLGGWLLERYWWGSVFLINVPIVVAVLVAGWLLVPESRHPSPPRVDLLGMVLSTASLASFLYAIIEAPESGWLGGEVIAGLGLALIAGIGFIGHERRVPEPMLDLRLFGNARLKWGTIAITLAMFALAGLTFDLTQFLQFVKGYSPLEAGLRILPLVVGFGLAGHIGQHLVRRVGTRWAVAGGLGAIAALLLAFAQVEPTTAYWLLGSGLFLIGIAMGTVFIPSTDAVMAAVPEANAGLGSALNDTSRQVGAALGIGVLGSLTNATYSAQIENSLTGLAPDMATLAKRSVGAALQVADGIGGEAGLTLHRAATEAFSDGFGLAMLAGAGLLSAGAVSVWRRLPLGDTSHPPAEADTALGAVGSERVAPVTE
jgi:EmrB/QacA subfamily drug resistance transporter